LISIKKYLDATTNVVLMDEPELTDLRVTVIDCYRALLRAIGSNAIRACHAPGANLEHQLTCLEASLSRHSTSDRLEEVQNQVEDRLERWGTLTADHLRGKADEVKELLIMMSRTAESVGERDQRYANQFADLTTDLKAIASLDDLTIVRSSLVRKANDLKDCVDKMTQEGHRALSELRTRVTDYETKLTAVEQLALKDTLTGLANRRSAEGRMEWYVSQQQTYCVVIVDLDGFKKVNDSHGHAAGDDLLRQFSDELQKNMRSTDMVARWGGDEFIVILTCDLVAATPQVERIRKWVLGKYKIQIGAGKEIAQVEVGASIGLAQWLPGRTAQQVMELADAAMYVDKKESRKPGRKAS
jgi:diguanylate cyclase (GGDEF)-like protein